MRQVLYQARSGHGIGQPSFRICGASFDLPTYKRAAHVDERLPARGGRKPASTKQIRYRCDEDALISAGSSAQAKLLARRA